MLAARQGKDRLARLGIMGGEAGCPLQLFFPFFFPLSMTQSAEPNFFRASALIRLNNWKGLNSPAALSAGPPSTQEIPPSGINVTFTSAKS